MTTNKPTEKQIKQAVEYSMLKYKKTYELLAAYDKGTVKDTEVLARPSNVRKTLQKFRNNTRRERTTSTL